MYDKIYNLQNLYGAYLKTRRGKRWKSSAVKFEINLIEALLLLKKQLIDKTYTLSQYNVFKVYEPKERLVMSNGYKDKVVQHSLCDNVLEPIIIDHDILKGMLRKMITCQDTLWLCDLIIDSTDGKGIPIGNQSSQLFALLYLNGLDHYIKDKLGVKFYGRYMDDFFLIHKDKNYLKQCLVEINEFVARLGLELNEKTHIFPLRNGINFLGFHTYLTETGKVIMKLRSDKKHKLLRKYKKMYKLCQQGIIDQQAINLSWQSTKGHIARGNTHHLLNDLEFKLKEIQNGNFK